MILVTAGTAGASVSNRFVGAVLGVVAGLGVPFHWLLWRAYEARRAWWWTWLRTEFHKNGEIYLCLALAAVTVFSVLGYWIGKRADDLTDESASAKQDSVAFAQMAMTDPLTGLLNPRAVHERLALELEDAHLTPLTCLLIDIDHFKKINDRYGHPFGDFVLAHVAKLLKRAVRRVDAVGRLGGEEFVILLPNAPQSRAQLVAERVRRTVMTHLFEFDGRRIHVTISLGAVTVPSPHLHSQADLFKAVDEALYAAKNAGRNRVVIWKEKPLASPPAIADRAA